MAKKRPQPPITAEISNISHDGRGVTDINGKRVFVEGALAGETVVMRYTRQRASFAEAEVIDILKPSARRQTARCTHFGVCGGCQLQHISTQDQLTQKQQMLLELLQHQANITAAEVLPPLTAQEWGYRRKARLGVKYVAGKQKVLIGFRERDARFIADLRCCEVLHPSVGRHLETISNTLHQLQQRDKIAQIEIAVSDDETALILRNLATLPEADLALLRHLGSTLNYKIYLQPKGLDSVYLLYPQDAAATLQYTLPTQGLQFTFHPTDFTQINRDINHQLVQQTLELLTLEPQDNTLDLFCGIGNFSLALAQHCQQVIGVEGAETAVERASANARQNQLSNVTFYTENLFEPPFKEEWCQRHYDKLVLDPPRSGAKEVIPLLDIWKPQKIVYVSCNPATLARDIGLMARHSYQLQKVGIANMFPHTKHIEAIALLTRLQQ